MIGVDTEITFTSSLYDFVIGRVRYRCERVECPSYCSISESAWPIWATISDIPQLYGAEDQSIPVQHDEIEVCESECTFKGRYPCDKDVLCTILMAERDPAVPQNADEGLQL